ATPPCMVLFSIVVLTHRSTSHTCFYVTCTSLSLDMVFLFQSFLDHPDLHSFPTRRSSDLVHRDRCSPTPGLAGRSQEGQRRALRSEEHTSELQSRVELVCRLLLEKKKTAGDVQARRYGKVEVRRGELRPGEVGEGEQRAET